MIKQCLKKITEGNNLTAEEADEDVKNILNTLERELGAVLR